MRALSALAAVVALLLTVATLSLVGGVLFALFLFFPLFLLALVTVISALDDHTVRQHNPSMSPTGWRDGSRAADARDRRDLHAAPRQHEPERRAA
jgi:hypothetical protein